MNLARRFWYAYLGLAAVFGGAIGTFIVLWERPAPLPPPPWSSWKPTADEPGVQQQQIATHVGAQYRLSNGHKLVDVVVGGPGTPSDPIRAVAISRTLTPTQQSDLLGFVTADKAAMFMLCGDGPKCSIKDGKASLERGAMLRREALELALYTFRYIDDAGSVVAFFPPKKGDDPAYALLFARSEFSKQLDEPLRQTLPQAKRPLPGKLLPVERKVVDALTQPYFFRWEVQRDQNGARVLVLARGN